ncbi:MAG: twitching motility protein PilT [Caulobacter sp.]|jgi:predicted nucleic acid-binding protein|nr:twitching motility protein PilT [Caulobacter sp.]
MFYLDTSLIVSLITNEAHTPDARGWLSNHLTDELAISLWVTTEVSSALSMKLRTGQIDAAERGQAASAYAALVAGSLLNLPISTTAFTVAARYSDREDLGLRGPDALHLAIAAEHGAELCTMDRPLARAALALGLPVHLI